MSLEKDKDKKKEKGDSEEAPKEPGQIEEKQGKDDISMIWYKS